MEPYDPTGPLPRGTVLLEASAGTGKTHAIAALATRYLAEGVVSADRLAVISFSRMASAELRSRVRRRLQSSLAVLRGSAAAHDPVDALLLSGTPEQVSAREANLTQALAGIDAATIMTIHQFCQAMLDELGVLADVDSRATLVEDTDRLLEEVVDDLYLARYARLPQRPPFGLTTARQLARDALALPEAPLVPEQAQPREAERLVFAAAVRQEVLRRKQRLGVFTFDDQLTRLRDVLQREATAGAGTPGAGRLRRRCQVVLVDEFQDTDPVQWQILRDTFDSRVPLVLIGDPKQSIYGFRGADTAAYSEAVATAAQRFSLPFNHRSDAGVVAGVNALFGDVPLGAGITAPPVVAVHTGSRITAPAGSRWQAAVRLRCLAPETPLPVAIAREQIAADLVAEVVDLLSGGATVQPEGSPRPVRASDIAVLVSSNRRGRELSDALARAGIPVSNAGAESIFASTAARDWLTLLRALTQPRQALVRETVLTDFVGGDLTALALADDDTFTDWAGLVQQWSRVLANDGVAALFATLQASDPGGGTDLAGRLLGRERGERDLTDHRHLAELLHEQYTAGVRGTSLAAWLETQLLHADSGADRLRRLETDRLAVQVLTVHKAKGLQFPVVLVPEATDLASWREDRDQKLEFHLDGTRVLDLGGRRAPGRAGRLRLHEEEQAQERLRSLYVATTRAQSRLVLWWARTPVNTAESPLHRLLFCDRSQGAAPLTSYPLDTPPGDGHPRDLGWLAAAGVSVEDAEPDRAAVLAPPPPPTAVLRTLDWRRAIDQRWRRTSYSGLTAAVHVRPPLALTAGRLVDDEPPAELPLSETIPAGTPSPMADLPGGTSFGSLVHDVFEHLDWYAPTTDELPALGARLTRAAGDAGRRFAVPGVSTEALAAAMLPGLLTPLGRLTGGRPLAQVPVRDRLSELDFEFALGDRSGTTVLRDVARLLARWLPEDDPLAAYPASLAAPELADQALYGFLTGSIDAVIRVPAGDGDRFVVIDYKTNRLGPPGSLLLEHYAPAPMAAEMIRSHYPLQAVLYCVALHRFLGRRLRGYDPERHLGGVGYLFVRGLGGPDAGQSGVFSWFPPAGLVSDLSQLLAGRGAR